MNITLPPVAGPLADVWPLLFDLAEARPSGWVVAGAQMVVLHLSAHGVARRTVTEDADVLVDVRELATGDVSRWLEDRGFDLITVSPDGVGHRFHRDGISVDVLAIDHLGGADRTTIPPAHTIEVPGGRRAMRGTIRASVTTAEGTTGAVPIPNWLGAVLLKARAVVHVQDQRSKHAEDLAQLLGLPVNVVRSAKDLVGKDRRHIRRAREYLDDGIWRAVNQTTDVRAAKAALDILTD